VMPGTWSMGGRLTDDEMIASGFVAGQEFRNKRVTKDRVEAAYGALANGDRTPIEEYWDQDVTWLAPGESRISGIKTGLDEFIKFMKAVSELSGKSFVMVRYGILVSSDQTVNFSHNTASRAGYPDRK